MVNTFEIDRVVSDITLTSGNKSAIFNYDNLTDNQQRTITLLDQDVILVGTTNSQTFTNKTIDADQNTITNLENDNIKLGAGIDVTKLGDGSVSNAKFAQLSSIASTVAITPMAYPMSTNWHL